MQVIQLEKTNSMISKLVEDVINGEEIIFTKKEHDVAKMVALPFPKKPRTFGSAKDVILYIADDFDETPEEFNEYIK
ncbi:MAG: hypothetical protein KGZ58_07390 [Ignavibacteriales bacterium]|nr:hypothetical protein [Ignavibacteriales bacterium]